MICANAILDTGTALSGFAFVIIVTMASSFSAPTDRWRCLFLLIYLIATTAFLFGIESRAAKRKAGCVPTTREDSTAR